MTHNHFASKPDAVRGRLLSFLHNNFLGERPRVEVFGGPRKDELQAFEGKYFPIPDYGVALWLGREPENEVQLEQPVGLRLAALLEEIADRGDVVEFGAHKGMEGYFATVREYGEERKGGWWSAGHGTTPFRAIQEADRIRRGEQEETKYNSEDFPCNV